MLLLYTDKETDIIMPETKNLNLAPHICSAGDMQKSKEQAEREGRGEAKRETCGETESAKESDLKV